MSERLAVGKLPADFLSDLLARYGARSRRVLTPPAVGEDAAAYLTNLPCTVVAMDPVTAATDRLGWYVVHVNANDVATRGAEPMWFLFTLLLPPDEATSETVREIFDQVDEACREVGAELIGGHTEITDGLERPMAVGTMIGEITTFRLTSTRGARPGNAVVMTGWCGLEGTAILANDHGSSLRGHGIADDVIDRASRLLHSPGISAVPAVRIAMAQARPHAMHDPTEGGLATALHEIAHAADVGVHIDGAHVPVLAETDAICKRLGLDPWGLMGSGSLLLCVDRVDVEGLLKAYAEAGINAAEIGTVVSRDRGIRRVGPNGQSAAIAALTTDELLRAIRMFEHE